MTRLDATSEPSMEDILASIRRIIAEDPPGSRAVPVAPPASQAQPSTPQTSLRSTDRDRFSPFGSRDSDDVAQSAAPLPEPYLRATPEPSKTAFGSEPFFSSTPASSSASPYAAPNAATSSRIEPSFGSISGPLPSADISPASKSPDLSVDAQLSELLGETATVSIKQASAPAAPLRFGDRMAGLGSKAPVAEQQSKPLDIRPGFTVSRDGFVGDAGNTPAASEPDPFDFDLGPSPFQTKPAEQAAAPVTAPAPTGNSLTARMSASSLERISAPSVAATMPAADSAAPPTAQEPEDAVAAVAFADQAPSIEPEVETPWTPTTAPSVAATIAPRSFEPVPEPESVARFIPANASVETPKQVEHDVLEVRSPERNDMEVMRVSAEAETHYEPHHDAASSTAIAVAAADGQMRSMEDTVAELLRPMLKAWLAENMPRIVERALRREITEQMLGDTKAAAE